MISEFLQYLGAGMIVISLFWLREKNRFGWYLQWFGSSFIFLWALQNGFYGIAFLNFVAMMISIDSITKWKRR